MRFPLVRKELRELRPYLVLGVVLTIIEVLGVALDQPDLRPLGSTFNSLLDDANGFLLVLAAAVGMGLSTRERAEGTLAFLDGLPISRSHLFVAKVACAVPVLMVYPMGRALLAVVTHLLSRGSLDQQLHLPILATVLALQSLMVLVGLLFGAALGLLRSLSWLMGALAAAGLEALGRWMPRARVLNPVHLLEPHLRGSRWEVDVEGVLVQVSLAILFGLIAWAGFTGVGAAGIESVKRRPLASALVSGLTVAALLAALTLASSTPAADEEVHFPRSPPAEEHTEHYVFSYRSTDAPAAHALAKDADLIFAEVHALLRAPLGEPITVDLTGSKRNTPGTAFLGRIRMEIGAHPGAVLAHETSHVVSGRLAGADRAELWNQATVLDEGLANWVEGHLGPTATPDEDALILGALQARHELNFDELVDFERFARLRDGDLKYPVGVALVKAMVDVYGADAPGRLVRAFGNPTLPSSLKGMQLWQATFQLAGMDLGQVTDELFASLDDDAEDLAAEISELPRPQATLVGGAGGRLGVQIAADRPVRGWHLVVRFRPNPTSPTETYDTEWVPANGQPVWRAPSQVEGHRVCLQPGIRHWPGPALYEPWSCLSEDDAAPGSSPDDPTPMVDGGPDSSQ